MFSGRIRSVQIHSACDGYSVQRQVRVHTRTLLIFRSETQLSCRNLNQNPSSSEQRAGEISDVSDRPQRDEVETFAEDSLKDISVILAGNNDVIGL